MKRTLAKLMLGGAAFIAVQFLPSLAKASALGDEAFLTGTTPSLGEYTVGGLGAQNPTVAGFATAWTGGGNVSATSLSYSDPNYDAPTGGSIKTTNANRWWRNLDTTLRSSLSSSASGTVYMSFLANFTGGVGSWNYAALELGTSGVDASKAFAIGIDGSVSGNFMYQFNNGTKTSLGVARDNNTHLFLVKFDLSSTVGSDAVHMWVDPTLGGVGDPSGGVAVSGLTLSSMNDLQIGSGAANNSFDEIRFGTTLADVTMVVPEPATGVLVIASAGFGLLARRRRKA